MTWLLGIGGLLKQGLSALFGLIRTHPWQAACLALLLASLWLWQGRNEARDQLAQRIAAEKGATGAQKRVNDAVQTHYTEKAHEADTKHDDMVAEAFDATARYIDKHRLQPADRTCQAPAPASGDGAGVPPEVPAGVVVGEADVRACADLYAYAVSARSWAQSLKVPENLLPGE
jgi:hypothetical protein